MIQNALMFLEGKLMQWLFVRSNLLLKWKDFLKKSDLKFTLPVSFLNLNVQYEQDNLNVRLLNLQLNELGQPELAVH